MNLVQLFVLVDNKQTKKIPVRVGLLHLVSQQCLMIIFEIVENFNGAPMPSKKTLLLHFVTIWNKHTSLASSVLHTTPVLNIYPSSPIGNAY